MTESKSLFARYRELSLGVRILIWMVIGGVLGGIFGAFNEGYRSV